MAIKNSPKGDKSLHLSSYHRNSPDPSVLQMYLEGKKHPAIPKCHPLIKKIIKKLKDKLVLDVGCGLGSVFCHALLFYGLNPENLYSLDPDQKNFKKDEYERRHKIVGEVEHMDLESDFFDVVHSNEMTLDNHDIDFSQSLKEICRVLKRKGLYIANEHFDEIEEISKTNPKIKKRSQNLINTINDDKLLKEIGFRPVIRVKYLNDAPGSKKFTLYLFQKR